MPDLVRARLPLPLRAHCAGFECSSLGPGANVVWKAAARPDRTWHSIHDYLSHPVCLLLALQHLSNRALSAFAHRKRNVGMA